MATKRPATVRVYTHVEGLEALLNSLNAAKGGTQTKAALRTGTRAGAKLVLAAAKANAPVDTGALRDNLKIKPIKRSRKYPGRIGFVIGNYDVEGGSLFRGDTFYAGMVEYGTVNQRGQPYLRPAFDSTKAAVVEVVRAKVGADVERRLRSGK